MATAAERGEQRIGRYTVLRRLARGGMAELFLVRATGLHGFQKVVALKRILPQFAGDPDFVRMFLDEARLAANLEHPNVATVYDIGRDGEDYFFTMEYVHGQTVRAILARTASQGTGLPLAHAVSIGIGIAAGIHHAHDRVGYDGTRLGLVHRDISPTNVIVSYDGAVKVLDFGIAKAATSSRVTSEGTRKGKVSYMSPEQVRNEPLDHRSDVFAIGIVLWEMATGRQLFDGSNEFAIMREILEGSVPPPSTIQPQVPPELDAIVLRALAADPGERFTSARDLQLALEAVSRDHRYDATAGALSRYMSESFGPTPLPWEEAAIHDEDEPVVILATRDLPPTRIVAGPLPTAEAMPSLTATSTSSIEVPGRRAQAAWVAIGLVAGIGALAWIVWPSARSDADARPNEAPSSSEAPTAAPTVAAPIEARPVQAPDAPPAKSDAAPEAASGVDAPPTDAQPSTDDRHPPRKRTTARRNARPAPDTPGEEPKRPPKQPGSSKPASPEYGELFDF